ncbi:NACHT domain-containing protein [Lentzea sp. BCCO 10_0856]|uniref:NACHT domain-containing protein n=1 Tax=Lentzea miocenica TaxID=3095431 RepID=A0ABU4T616_9PSEU|nr:pentapeptide repeat-containing protein [Lentzea sp. BCCO 10_0856]MDX8033605.1 NACHT domain-containing protein [Lentzea sp. BCCO 10_0856]
MTTPLRPNEITDRINALRPSLTTMQAARLTAIGEVVGESGQFLLRQALAAGDFPEGDERAQDAFRDFRNKINYLAAKAGVDLVLELESRKTTPDHRHGWFAGNPVEKSLVAFTEVNAENIGITKPIAPAVRELGEPRRLRIYVSFHPTTARNAAALIEQLTTALRVLDGAEWEIKDSSSVLVGDDIAATRAQLLAQADVCVCLISPAYVDSPERQMVLSSRKLVAVAFAGLPNLAGGLKPLQRHEIALQDSPWEELRGPAQRKVFINEVVRQIRLMMDKPLSRDDDQTTILKALAAKQVRLRRDDSRYLVPSQLREASLQESLLDSGDQRASGISLPAVERLVAWATADDSSAPRLCALLGDVGMGKTTTTKLFATQLLKLHDDDQASPLPILFDLRDIEPGELSGSMSLDRILTHLLDATRPQGVSSKRLNADVVRERLEHDLNRTVVIFDGLDEVLVHLSPHKRQLFTRQLWRALPAESNARMLLSCRTQYFRTIRDEADFFTGQTRQGLRSSDYLALLMLPFTENQIREYLEGNLDRDAEWVDRFLETIGAVHNLTELAQRPITLRLISDQVEFIEKAKLEGRELRSVDIYAEVVDRWITRDEGKHTLTPDHKRLLMEEIAAALWRSGKNAWSPAEVDDWLLGLLDQRPDLRRHYREHVPDLWTADFRTATFLKREGDTFEFAHRSLFEYFLACYLYRQLSDPRAIDALAMPVPSQETLDFLGQSIAASPGAARATLELIGRQYRAQISELAVAYALHAARRGYPHQSLVEVDLSGAALAGWTFTGRGRLALNNANLSGADLSRTSFFNSDLTGADLTNSYAGNAEFHESTLASSSWQDAYIAGAIFRRCDITGVDLSQSNAYRTQLLLCTPPPAPSPHFQIAPSSARAGSQSSAAAQLNCFVGPIGAINAITWSPDNTHILTGSNDGIARVWDTTTGQQIHQLAGHTDVVNAIACSPDNTRIYTGGEDRTARIWDTTTGRQIHQLTGHTDAVGAIACSPDNTRVLTGDDGGDVRIWDTTTGRQIHQLIGHETWLNTVAWSPDNTRALTGSNDGSIRIWDTTTARQIHKLTGHKGAVFAIACSSDNTRIITGGADRSVRIWDATTGQQIRQFTGHTDWVKSVAYSPDNTRILTGGSDGTARIWDAATGQLIHQFTGHDRPVNAITCSPDNTRVYTGSEDGTAHTWDTTGHRFHTLVVQDDWINAVAWSSDNTRIVTGSEDGTARIWDTTTGQQVHKLTSHGNAINAVAWSPDNACVLTGSDDRSVRIWDTTTGQQINHLTGHNGLVHAVAYSPDNTRILTGGSDGTARIWDTTTGQQIHTLTGHTGPVNAITCSPDNTRILTGGADRSVRIWDATTGLEIHKLTGHNSPVNAITCSPDNTRVLTGSDDSTARIWDATTGLEIHKLTGHTDWVRSVAWSPDNTRILTGSDDRSVRIWDATTGLEIHKLTGHTDWVKSVAWSPDNTRIVTSSDDNTARIWDATTGELLSPYVVLLPDKEFAVFDGQMTKVIECSKGAWRWIGWNVIGDQGIDRLPAETFGPLPVRPD